MRRDVERRVDGSPPSCREVPHRRFPWPGPLQHRIVLKGWFTPSDFPSVATITRDTQLDLLHYVIETQRLVNAVPTTGLKGSERAIGLVLDRVQIVTNADGAAVEVAEGNVLVSQAVSGLATDGRGARVDLDSSLSGLCVRVGMPLLCRDTETDARVDAEACRSAGVRSIAVAPMVRAGETLGVLKVMSGEAEHFDDADADVARVDGQPDRFQPAQFHEARAGSRPCSP